MSILADLSRTEARRLAQAREMAETASEPAAPSLRDRALQAHRNQQEQERRERERREQDRLRTAREWLRNALYAALGHGPDTSRCVWLPTRLPVFDPEVDGADVKDDALFGWVDADGLRLGFAHQGGAWLLALIRDDAAYLFSSLEGLGALLADPPYIPDADCSPLAERTRREGGAS